MSRARDMADLGAVTARLDTVGGSEGALSNRRLTINGDMTVAQRGSIPAIQTGYGACDRFRLASNSAARFDTSQSTDAPSGQGFSKSLKLDCSTADTSVAAGDYYQLQHMIEGQNLQHLSHGSSSAKQCTLSFWVKSPKTGIHNLEIQHVDGGVYNIYQYTIASANTWQNVSFTFDGYQTTAIANDNTAGLVIVWWLIGGTTFSGGSYSENTCTSSNANRAVGQVNVADSTSNDFYLTGVQLEVGAQETPFEHRSFGQELALCQRYYFQMGGEGIYERFADGFNNSSTQARCVTHFPVTMRSAPSVAYTSNLLIVSSASNGDVTSIVADYNNTHMGHVKYNASGASLTAGQGAAIAANNSTATRLKFEAEL